MSAPIERRVFPSSEQLPSAVADRLGVLLDERKDAQQPIHVVLTGGSMGQGLMECIASRVSRGQVPPHRLAMVHLWWGDERFLYAGDPERNDSGPTDLVLRTAPIPLTQVHRVEGPINHVDVHTSARWYRESLEAWAPVREDDTRFDLVFLGVGPDGHVASLFPGLADPEEELSVIGVDGSPKPPAYRVSMSARTLSQSRAVWFLATGEDKAEAIARASGAWRADTPGSWVRGTEGTVFWIDEAAAASPE